MFIHEEYEGSVPLTDPDIANVEPDGRTSARRQECEMQG